eukprot:scaffold242196_cov17-Prasinocladus_malaysianus.AAC.3
MAQLDNLASGVEWGDEWMIRALATALNLRISGVFVSWADVHDLGISSPRLSMYPEISGGSQDLVSCYVILRAADKAAHYDILDVVDDF